MLATKQKKKKAKPSYLEAVRKSLAFIADNMRNFETVCVHLVAKGALTYDEVEEIKSKTSTNQKIMEMMKKFSRKSKKDFTHFMTVLNEKGQEHVAQEIGLNRQEVKSQRRDGNGAEEKDKEDAKEEEERGRSKRKKKKGKIYSIYLASDEENDPSDDEEKDKDEFDSENPNITLNTLTDYLVFLEEFVKHLNFDPTLRFRVSRAVYLDKIGFYGPEAAGIAAYEVDTRLTFWPCKGEVLGSAQEVIEVVNQEIMYVSPGGTDNPIPIRPHVWHMLTFSIKGREIMVAQQPENLAQLVSVPYHPDSGDAVLFEFDVTGCWCSCQIPEMIFYKGKNRIPTSNFPRRAGRTCWKILYDNILGGGVVNE